MSTAEGDIDRRAATSDTPILSVDGLSVRFPQRSGAVEAVTDLTFDLQRNHVLALVGESGSGKSVTASAIAGLLPGSARPEVDGSISVAGSQIVGAAEKDLNALRGTTVGTIFQNPATSFDPSFTIGGQLVELIRLHREVSRTEAREVAGEWLDRVGIRDTVRVLGSYPHQLSGGMAQRVCIALAMMGGGQLVVADEPTSGLDALVKRRVADLLERTVAHEGSTMVLVTHDLYLARRLATRVAVMYGGFLVESGPSEEFFQRPQHPYSQALLGSMPEPGKPLSVLKGSAPRGTTTRSTCVFSERCPIRDPHCANSIPEMRELTPGHHVASWCVA